jgi:hypothetical protein
MAFWFTGVGLFMVELKAGVDYVQEHLTGLTLNFLDVLPAFSLATWRIVERVFWHYGQLESAFRTMPFVTLPFMLLAMAAIMKRHGYERQVRSNQ